MDEPDSDEVQIFVDGNVETIVSGQDVTTIINGQLAEGTEDPDSDQVALVMILVLLGVIAVGAVITVLIISRRRHKKRLLIEKELQ